MRPRQKFDENSPLVRSGEPSVEIPLDIMRDEFGEDSIVTSGKGGHDIPGSLIVSDEASSPSKRVANTAEQELRRRKASKIYRNLIHSVARDLLFTDRLAIESQECGQCTFWGPINRFADGTRFMSSKVWPVAFTGLILHDVIEYCRHSLWNYGVGFRQIFTGTANSQYMLMTHMGSDLVTEGNYWIGASIIFGSVIVGGIVAVVSPILAARSPRLAQKLSQFYEILSQLRDRHHLFSNYHKWSYGQEGDWSWRSEAVFLVATAYVLYAEIMLGMLLIKKLMGVEKYQSDWNQCSQKNMSYVTIEQLGNFACVVCTWDFVDYWKRQTSQGCLDGLLSEPRSPEFILAGLDVIVKHKDFCSIDGSKQNFSNWTKPQFSDFLSKFIHSGIESIEKFNFSSPFQNVAFRDDGRIEDLHNFFKKIDVKIVDLTNQGIGAEKIKILAPSLNRSEQIIYTGNELTGDGQLTAVQNLGNNTVEVVFDRNNVDDDGMVASLPLMPASVKHGSFGENKFGDRGLQATGDWIALGNAESIIMDGTKRLAEADFDHFGKKVEGSALKKFSGKNIGMNDAQVDDFMPHLRYAKVEEIIFSDNPIRNRGFISTLEGSINTTVISVALDGVLADERGFQLAGPIIQRAGIKNISLARIRASVGGYIDLVRHFLNSTVESFIGSDNALGDAFFLACKNELAALKKVVLDRIQATDQGAAAFLTAAGNGNVEHVSVEGNLNLTDITLEAFRRIAEVSKITDLNLAKNNFGGKGGVVNLFESVALKNVILSENIKILSEEMYMLSTKLISNVPNKQLSEYNRDDIRWLQKNGMPSTNIKTIIADDNIADQKEQRAFSLIAPRAELDFSAKNSRVAGAGVLLVSAGLFSPGGTSVMKVAETAPIMKASIDIGLALGMGVFSLFLLLLLVYRIHKAYSSESSILPLNNNLGRGL